VVATTRGRCGDFQALARQDGERTPEQSSGNDEFVALPAAQVGVFPIAGCNPGMGGLRQGTTPVCTRATNQISDS